MTTTTAATIRPVTRDDFDQWLPLWEGYNSFYARTLPAEVTASTWQRFIDPATPTHALVAERDGALVGFVHYLYHLSTGTIEPNCYLQDLFTAPDARASGIGEALIHAVYAAARERGAARVYWLTQDSNVTARRLYDRIADNSGFLMYRKML